MNEKKNRKRKLTRIGTLLILCFLTPLFFLVVSCNGATVEDLPEGTKQLVLFFANFFPDIVMAADGDGDFLKLDVNANEVSFDVTDPDGRFSLLAIGEYGGFKHGYFFKTTVDDIPKINLNFDPTNVKKTYTIDGSNSGSPSFIELSLGTMFKSFSGPSYNVSFDRDEDRGKWDLVAAGFNTVTSYQVFRDNEPQDQTINFAWDASHLGEDVSVDVSAINGDSSYFGTNAYILTPRLTWAYLGSDFSNPTWKFQKFPAAI
jgi:hypothetical protein